MHECFEMFVSAAEHCLHSVSAATSSRPTVVFLAMWLYLKALSVHLQVDAEFDEGWWKQQNMNRDQNLTLTVWIVSVC